MQNIASHGAVLTKLRPTIARMTGANTPPISILLQTLRLICPPPVPIDWIIPFRLARKYHGEEKFYNLSVLCQFACPPPSSPSPLHLPPLPLPSLLPATVIAVAIILFVAVAIPVACPPHSLPSPLPSSALLQSTHLQSLSPKYLFRNFAYFKRSGYAQS